ncbi:L,D-transpeptidase [Massilia sp. KIM]|uniref:L,D-transpeptidase n=1 Tax=Massilia sp. KIM TaxID=1955422 RepID=UPI00098F7011|nr:L,D-transpeptidase [Massilia sp. KIM]OON59562.1 L,D-transpeptidase [Massilia sp. KIM]
MATQPSPRPVSARPAAKPKTKRIKVDLAKQTVETYEDDAKVHQFECVSGDDDHPTDRGSFRILRKHHPYRSRAYDVQMNYAMFFIREPRRPPVKALHQYHGPAPLSVLRTLRSRVSAWFGSHGCVRLSETDARALYEWAPIGTQVTVV